MAERRVDEAVCVHKVHPLPQLHQLALAAGVFLLLFSFAKNTAVLRGGWAGASGGGTAGSRYAAGWRLAGAGEPMLPKLMGTDGSPHVFSMDPAAPSRAAFYAMQADPGFLGAEANLVREFEAAPWLLSPRTPSLPYAGVHGLDDLLALRSLPAGKQPKSVALLLFSKPWAVMAQNSVYSLVKHGGVRNYVALTWSQADLEACADLNLPCADVSSLLVEPMFTTERLLLHDFLLMMWLKPAVALRALRQGHAVMFVDTDASYTVKPLWDSYLAFIEQAQGDGAWQSESPVNSGHFVLLPTPAALAFTEAWNASAPAMLAANVSEQKALPDMENSTFYICRTPCLCYRHKYELLAEGKRDRVAIFPTYFPGYISYTGSRCTVGAAQWMPTIDPCDWTTPFVHPICASGAATKQAVLSQLGMWHMDNEGCQPQPGAASQVPACKPLRWRVADAEARLYSCLSYGLGLVHGDVPPAIRQLQAGASAEQAKRLLAASADKECNGRLEPFSF